MEDKLRFLEISRDSSNMRKKIRVLKWVLTLMNYLRLKGNYKIDNQTLFEMTYFGNQGLGFLY